MERLLIFLRSLVSTFHILLFVLLVVATKGASVHELSKLATMTKGSIRISAVIFDLDGTLLDTETLSSNAIQMALTRVGCQKPFTWDLKKKLLGLRGPDWSRMVVDELELHGILEPTELVSEWERNLNGLCSEVVKVPGAEELTSRLEAMGIPMAIATSSRSEAVSIKRRKHEEMFNRMSLIVCGDDPDVIHGKPAPDIYLTAAKRLGVDPQSCLVFEDALAGVQAARRAGMHVVACPDPRLDMSVFLSETSHVLSGEVAGQQSLQSLEGFDWSIWDFQA
jgi:pseudouridine 5'-phosphatase